MDAKILKQLELSDSQGALPAWTDVETLVQTATSLRNHLESVLRNKLLIELQDRLKLLKIKARFCLEDELLTEIDISTPHDEQFAESVDLWIDVDDSVRVSIGSNPGDQLWIGYMKQPGSKLVNSGKLNLITEEAKEHLSRDKGPGGVWYAWGYETIAYNSPISSIAAKYVNKLTNMRDGLEKRFKVGKIL